ncbi:hypothetical protein G7Y89_g4260 [Cudoniella acicularis]|uniref:Pinin/SDK/MemA protein domain-containing protein n=1 Tax=Cudoniella acicularis TaxID=354080 RepID=A0A8H4W565_9HELO|nr:hypothetical protein G7Y89_g4260 [Cudoniella acicularis]
MADSIGPIASAVIIPETAASKSPTPTGVKRRQSSEPESLSKRPRISEEPIVASPSTLKASPPATKTEDASSTDPQPKDTSQDRQKSSVQEERKRGQRLFGGLLSTLSQSTPNGQQKRRLEIEKRQQEKAKQQKAEDEGRRAQKLADLKATRRAEQIKFEEQSVRAAEQGLFNKVNFWEDANTTFEYAGNGAIPLYQDPAEYYKPWELLPRDEDRIKTQIAEAEAVIKQDLEDFNRLHPERASQTSTEEKANITSAETVGEPQTESPSVSKVADTTNDTPVTQSEKQALEEHNGEVVVENEEDTVIY